MCFGGEHRVWQLLRIDCWRLVLEFESVEVMNIICRNVLKYLIFWGVDYDLTTLQETFSLLQHDFF